MACARTGSDDVTRILTSARSRAKAGDRSDAAVYEGICSGASPAPPSDNKSADSSDSWLALWDGLPWPSTRAIGLCMRTIDVAQFTASMSDDDDFGTSVSGDRDDYDESDSDNDSDDDSDQDDEDVGRVGEDSGDDATSDGDDDGDDSSDMFVAGSSDSDEDAHAMRSVKRVRTERTKQSGSDADAGAASAGGGDGEDAAKTPVVPQVPSQLPACRPPRHSCAQSKLPLCLLLMLACAAVCACVGQMRGRYFAGPDVKVTCYNCRKMGHFAASCPFDKVILRWWVGVCLCGVCGVVRTFCCQCGRG